MARPSAHSAPRLGLPCSNRNDPWWIPPLPLWCRYAPVGHQGHHPRTPCRCRDVAKKPCPQAEGVKCVGPHVDSDLSPLGIEAWFFVTLLGRLHHIQPRRQGRFGASPPRSPTCECAGDWESNSHPDVLTHCPSACAPTLPCAPRSRFNESRPFLKRQTADSGTGPNRGRGGNRGAGSTNPTASGPSLHPWVFVACPAQQGGNTRSMLHGQTHFQEAIVGGQISLLGKSDPGKRPCVTSEARMDQANCGHLRRVPSQGQHGPTAPQCWEAPPSPSRRRAPGRRSVAAALGWTQTRPRTTRHANGRLRGRNVQRVHTSHWAASTRAAPYRVVVTGELP